MIELPPLPGRIAELPRDPRGYPVPAESLWRRGRPELAVQDFRRCGALYAHGCCAVCGLPLTSGESVYRLFAHDDAEQTLTQNACKRTDGPGHRDCMILSGALCPFFATAGARRNRETSETLKGTPRGTTAALLGFETVHIAVAQEPPHQLWFHYGGVREHIAFTDGQEMAALLTATEPPRGPAAIRRYWKTEPEVKRVWAQTLKLAAQHGTSMLG